MFFIKSYLCSLLCSCAVVSSFFFFFNDTATTEIYTLSLHDALPISAASWAWPATCPAISCAWPRSEEHTSELQSPDQLVCRLLLEKKKKTSYSPHKTENKKHTKTINQYIAN